jgi:hypothetical protein
MLSELVTRRGRGAAWCVVVVALCCAAQAPAEPDGHQDAWYETWVAGSRVGSVHRTVAVAGDSLFVTDVVSDVVVRRLGERVEMTQEDRWTETTGGRPVEYRSTRRLARGEETELVVEVGHDALSVRKSTARGDDGWVLPAAGELLFPVAVERLHAERGFTAGDSYVYVTFDADFEAVSRCSVTVVGNDTLHVTGKPVELNLLHVEPDVYEGLVIGEWRDVDGALWLQKIAGLGVEIRRTASEPAIDRGTTPDVVSGTMIEVNASVAQPERVDAALYEMWLEDDGDVAEFVEGDIRQEIVGRTDRGALVRVRRIVPPDAPSGGSEAAREEGGSIAERGDGREYLESNVLIQTDDPGVVEAARDAVAGIGPDPWKRAVAIESAVAHLVTDRGFGTAFASAAQVVDTRSGDCSEHAILAAAMARAVGIPSRVATGVIHFRGGFAYHMWVEVWVRGGWYALDPTQGLGSVDATHIRLGGGSLAGGRVADLSLSVLRTANRLGIQIVEYEVGGRTHRPE